MSNPFLFMLECPSYPRHELIGPASFHAPLAARSNWAHAWVCFPHAPLCTAAIGPATPSRTWFALATCPIGTVSPSPVILKLKMFFFSKLWYVIRIRFPSRLTFIAKSQLVSELRKRVRVMWIPSEWPCGYHVRSCLDHPILFVLLHRTILGTC
jgi:hypothetical protein